LISLALSARLKRTYTPMLQDVHLHYAALKKGKEICIL